MKKAIKVFLDFVITAFSLFLLTLVGLSIWIQIDVGRYKSIARKSFPNEKTVLDSMILYMNDSTRTFEDRNYMVWAIGQKADKKALPFLLANYTGTPCDHSAYLCQYGLEKAIKRCGGKMKYRYLK